MKALSVKQPWSGLISIGAKKLESRTWNTNYVGELLICSSLTESKEPILYENLEFNLMNHKNILSTKGKALSVATLVGCMPYTPNHCIQTLCNHFDGYVWKLVNIRRIVPFDVKGKLSLFEVDDSKIKYLDQIHYRYLNLSEDILEKLDYYVESLYQTESIIHFTGHENCKTEFSLIDLSKQFKISLISFGFSEFEINEINLVLDSFLLERI